MSIPAPKAYVEVRVDVPRDLAELVCDYIIENITSGLVLEEEEGSATTGVVFYVPADGHDFAASLNACLETLAAERNITAPAVRQRRIENVEWLEKYRESIKPVWIGDDIVVRPGWVTPQGALYELIVEPRMAFGTGSHPTTKSCLEAIRRVFRPGMRFLDMGCGSGILSILADRMGASYIKAIDYDLAAVENCGENFQINRVTAEHEIASGSIEKCAPDERYDVVCANIIRSTIVSMLPRLLALVAPRGALILSGLLEQDESAVSDALREQMQDDFSILRDESWLTYTVRKR